MITLNDFHQDFTQSVLSDAESRGLLKPQAFFEIFCDDLTNTGDLTKNYTYAEYIKKGTEVYGYDYDEERQILTLLNHQYFQDDSVQTLTRSQIDTKFARMKSFFSKSLNGLSDQMEETSEAYAMVYSIVRHWEKKEISKVRFMILSDGKATRLLSDIPSETLEGIQADFRVIDIEYLFKIYSSNQEYGDFELDVNLPCLIVNSQNSAYTSFLSVVSGNLLVDIYEQFGQKLFEQNVRTFLQFRGTVNRGLKNTIEDKPEMFFAFNNGITATATSVQLSPEGYLTKIRNFQIVNGGQTTSAIYAASKIGKFDVSQVAVQMKLSVVTDSGFQDEFVSKVSEYANTQNKINNSDFFSNSPFHKDMKEYSVRIYAPATGGGQRRTHWYYERVRGEYLNSQAYLTGEGKKKFQLENPKSQLIDKTLVAKSENAWQQKPHIVSKGAQDSFKRFADDITELIDKDNLAITEAYFRDAVARVILFRSVEKLITASDWYDGGFRAQTVAYSVSYLSAVTSESGLYLNFPLIWEIQCLPEPLIELLKIITEKVYKRITNPPVGYANISQWTKNAGCWTSVQQIDIDFGEVDASIFIEHEEQKFIEKKQKENKKIDTSINKQIAVIQTPVTVWQKLDHYFQEGSSSLKPSSIMLDLLSKMGKGVIALPSEKQSAILYEILLAAKKDGLKTD